MEEILHHLTYRNLVNNGINYLATGAGFLPSTVVRVFGVSASGGILFFLLPKDWCWHLWNLPSLVNGKMSLMLIHPWIWRLYNSASEEKNVFYFFFWGGKTDRLDDLCWFVEFFFVGWMYEYIYICINTYTHILYIFAWKLFVLYFVEPFNPAFRRPKLEGQNRGQNKTNFWKIIDAGGDMWWTSQEF